MIDEHWNPDGSGTFERVETLLDYAEEQTSRATKCTSAVSGPMLGHDSFPGHTVIERLRSGGQGTVYRAIHESTKRTVAIKVTREDAQHDSASRSRFAREVDVLSALHHPNIVRLADAGEVAGHFYFVTDYIDGEPLDAYTSRVEPTVPALARLFIKICDAINAAHLRGIVHRDLKPSNILVDCNGEPHILDFGLAKLIDPDANETLRWSGLTITGQFVGSIPWATPEQVAGDSDKIDVRTDVYALGVVLYHMLTGRFPYDMSGSAESVIANILSAEADASCFSSMGVGADLQTIVLKCLSKDPGRRYQSAGELARDLGRFLNHEPIEAKLDSTWYVLSKTVRRHRLLAGGTLAFVLLLMAYAGTTTALLQRTRRAEVEARQAATAAHQRLKQARETIDFLTGEVSATLSNLPGASQARRTILEGAYSQLVDLAEDVPDDPRLVDDIAQVHGQLGGIAHSLGDLARADDHFATQLRLREQRASETPDDADIQLALADALMQMGHISNARLDLRGAENAYQRALRIYEAGSLEYRDVSRVARGLFNANERLGYMAVEAGNLQEAAAYYEKLFPLASTLQEGDLENHQVLRLLQRAHRQVAALSSIAGRTDQWLYHLGEAVSLGERLHALDPINVRHAAKLIHLYIDLIGHDATIGHYADAHTNADRALELLNIIPEEEPPIISRIGVRTRLYTMLGYLARTESDWAAAEKYDRASLTVARVLVGVAPNDFRAHKGLFQALGSVGTDLFRQDRVDEAREYSLESMAVARELAQTDNISPHELSMIAHSFLNIQPTEIRDYNEIIALLHRAIDSSPGVIPNMVINLSRAYREAGRTDEAMACLCNGLSRLSADATEGRELLAGELGRLSAEPAPSESVSTRVP